MRNEESACLEHEIEKPSVEFSFWKSSQVEYYILSICVDFV